MACFELNSLIAKEDADFERYAVTVLILKYGPALKKKCCDMTKSN